MYSSDMNNVTEMLSVLTDKEKLGKPGILKHKNTNTNTNKHIKVTYKSITLVQGGDGNNET